MVREAANVPRSTPWRVSPDRLVNGLEECLGRFVHGLGPGPEGFAKPIPLFFQLLEPDKHYLSYRPGDAAHQVLTNDQNRFSLPRSLAPVVGLLLPGDEDNPLPDSLVVARHAYSEGAFRLLEDLLADGYRFSLKEFLRLAETLATVLAFLHEHGIVHGQWNARSVICVPIRSDATPFDDASSHRFDLLNTGVSYRDAHQIPADYLERGYFPAEILPPSTDLPDYEALDLEADVYCFAAFLRDLLERASRFEDLTRQAGAIQDYLHREALRHGQKPSSEQLRDKEQEILDHLYTIKLKTEEMVQDGLRERTRRSRAAELRQRSQDLFRRTTEYADRLFDIGFERVNVFGAQLQHYVPYKVRLTPDAVNNFEESTIELEGSGLPYELVRVSLGEWDTSVEVLEATPTSIRFKVGRGFSAGDHLVFINNRRTNRTLRVRAPRWIRVEPESLPRPWPGFGDIRVRVVGADLPRSALYRLVPEWTDPLGLPPEKEASAPVEAAPIDAVSVGPVTSESAAPAPPPGDAGDPEGAASSAADGEGAASVPPDEMPTLLEAVLIEFSSETPAGEYALVAGGLDTGLSLRIDPPLPEPRVHAIEPREVFNHREQELTLRGVDLHSTMVVDLGEAAAPGVTVRLRADSDRSATLAIPRGYPAGEYSLRVNRADTDVRLVVRNPVWKTCEPQIVKFRRDGATAAVELRGEALPAVSADSSDVYELESPRRRARRTVPLEAAVIEEERVHKLRLSRELRSGTHSIRFAGQATGLAVRVRHQVPRVVWLALVLAVLGLGGTAGALFGPALVDRLRPEITGLEPPVAFSFGDQRLRLEGARLTSVALVDAGGVVVREFPVDAADDDSADGGVRSYSFALESVPPGTYGLRPRGRLLRGKSASEELVVRSPAFQIEPRVIDRLRDGQLELASASGFPLASAPLERLGLSLLPEAPAGEGDGARATEAMEAAARELALEAGSVSVPAGTFARGEEGAYQVSLDGRLVGGDLTADGKPLTLEVVGPQVEALSPSRLTLTANGRVRVRLEGKRFPAAALGLISLDGEMEADAIAFRLLAGSENEFEGRVRPGRYALAWDLEAAPERIPDLALEVLPPPRVTEIEPRDVVPNRPVELEVRGVNLKEAEIVLRPLTGGDAVGLAVEQASFEVGADWVTRVKAKAISLPTGRFAVTPGDAVYLEVADDCDELLATYRTDLSEGERLRTCLQGDAVTDDVRRRAAATFFDQGLFDAAFELYGGLDDLESRFRAAFLRLFVRGEGSAAFAPREGDSPDAPYSRAAASLEWYPGASGGSFSESESSWDLDFVAGFTASEPGVAVEAFTRSIEKKKNAAAVEELQPFEASFDHLAAARLELGIRRLSQGAPLLARDYFRTAVMDETSFERLRQPDRARCHFYAGHMELWYSGSKERARGEFRRGMLPGGLAFSGLCRLYLEALGDSVSRPPPVMQFPPLPSWERDFVDGVRFYLQVLDGPNYNILAERDDFVFQSPRERQTNRELFQCLTRLEASEDPTDPFAHYAVLFFLRNAQKIAWPEERGGARWSEHRDRFLALELSDASDRVRNVFLAVGEAAPLALSQIAVMPRQEIVGLLERIDRIDASRLEGGLQDMLVRLKEKLTAEVSNP